MVQNWHEFADYLVMGEELGCRVLVNTVRQPSERSVYMLPTDQLRDVIQRGGEDLDRVTDRLGLDRSALYEQIGRPSVAVSVRSGR